MKEDGPRPGRSVCVVTQSSGSQEVPSIVLVQAWRSLLRRVRKHPTRRRSEAARVFRVECEREREIHTIRASDCLSLVGSRRLLAGGRQSATTTSQAKGTSTGAAVSGIDRQTSARSFFNLLYYIAVAPHEEAQPARRLLVLIGCSSRKVEGKKIREQKLIAQ